MVKTATVLSCVLMLAACQRSPFSDLTWRHGRTQFNVDRLNGQEIQDDKPIVIDANPSREWVVTGWAIDGVVGQPATGVLALVDNNKTLVAKYGYERPDIVTALHKPELAHTGFELHLENLALAPGRHSLSIVILTADGRGYYRTDHEWTIDAR